MQFTASFNSTTTPTAPARRRTRRTTDLWTIQVLLAAIFLFAGAAKLVMPADTLAEQSDLPVLFMCFVGLCEVLGAAGLILPGVFQTRLRLMPLAAAGLIVIMIGAMIVTVQSTGVAAATMPFAVGALAAVVAYSRSSNHFSARS